MISRSELMEVLRTPAWSSAARESFTVLRRRAAEAEPLEAARFSELTQGTGDWTFTVVYALYGWNISGSFRNLRMKSGKICATTHCDGAYSDGTVYELKLAKGVWMYTLLYEFTGGTDGRFSYSNLVSDKLGNLYGTTYAGGSQGAGVVFKVTP